MLENLLDQTKDVDVFVIENDFEKGITRVCFLNNLL